MEIGKAFVVAHCKGKHHAPLVVVPELTGDPLARVTRKEECVLVDKRLEGDEEGSGPPRKQFDVPRRERVRANLYVETGRRVGDGDAAFGHGEDVERDGENAVSELVRGPGGGHRASEGPTGRAVLTRPGFGTTLSARRTCQDSAVTKPTKVHSAVASVFTLVVAASAFSAPTARWPTVRTRKLPANTAPQVGTVEKQAACPPNGAEGGNARFLYLLGDEKLRNGVECEPDASARRVCLLWFAVSPRRKRPRS